MPPRPEPVTDGERLQKVLAAAGIGSRRACEELIAAGRVTVGGRTATLGDKVDPHAAEIFVDGERVVVDPDLVYLAMNKPRGVVSTMADERGRAALGDYLGRVPQRVFHVGRLDADSEGLLLLTNDGALAHRLTHPSYGVAKTYLAEVRGPLPRGVGRRLLAGVELEDGPARADSFRVVDSAPGKALVEVVLHEGRKHIVRRLLDEVGHPVERLVRTAVGPVKLGDLRAGRTRRLNRPEIAALFAAVAESPGSPEPDASDSGAAGRGAAERGAAEHGAAGRGGSGRGAAGQGADERGAARRGTGGRDSAGRGAGGPAAAAGRSSSRRGAGSRGARGERPA